MARTNAHVTEKVHFKPRLGFVLVRMVRVGETDAGIAIPEVSAEGKAFYVVACGPAAEGLAPGDRVLMVGGGTAGNDYWPVPNCRDLLVIKQENVALILEDRE